MKIVLTRHGRVTRAVVHGDPRTPRFTDNEYIGNAAVGIGEAKLSPFDVDDQSIADAIAVARGTADYARKLEAAALAAVQQKPEEWRVEGSENKVARNIYTGLSYPYTIYAERSTLGRVRFRVSDTVYPK